MCKIRNGDDGPTNTTPLCAISFEWSVVVRDHLEVLPSQALNPNIELRAYHTLPLLQNIAL